MQMLANFLVVNVLAPSLNCVNLTEILSYSTSLEHKLVQCNSSPNPPQLVENIGRGVGLCLGNTSPVITECSQILEDAYQYD